MFRREEEEEKVASVNRYIENKKQNKVEKLDSNDSEILRRSHIWLRCVLVIQMHITVAKLRGTGSFPRESVVGSYGSLFVVWGRNGVIFGILVVTRG
jgi:hypothetical protein